MPSPRSTLAHPIDVVWSCSPGPGLSRARRGTGVPGERVCSSRSVRGAPRLTFPPWPSGRGRKAGAGLRPLALTFGLLSPASGGVGGGRGSSDTADALASPSRRVLRERPSPRWGGLNRCCAAPPPRGCASVPRCVDCSPPGSSIHGDSPGKNTGVGTCSLLQGIFPTQGSSSGLLHCKPIRYLSHQEETHEGTRS